MRAVGERGRAEVVEHAVAARGRVNRARRAARVAVVPEARRRIRRHLDHQEERESRVRLRRGERELGHLPRRVVGADGRRPGRRSSRDQERLVCARALHEVVAIAALVVPLLHRARVDCWRSPCITERTSIGLEP